MEDIEFKLSGCRFLQWSNFILNPRRLRGADFLMRWSQGEWSEERLIQAVNSTEKYTALPYGPSGVAPHDDVREFELYFERLEKAGLGKIKRPDLLIFLKRDEPSINNVIKSLGGIQELPFTKEDNRDLKRLLSMAILAVECENSLWKAKKMPDFNSTLTAQKRLGGKLGLKKTAVLPTVILKEEDRIPLKKWQREHGVKIHIWHVFFDLAFGLALDKAEELIKRKLILPTEQVFQAPGGATTKKPIYKFYHQYAYPLGEATQEAHLAPAFIEDKNGHILPYVKFEGGNLRITDNALQILDDVKESK